MKRLPIGISDFKELIEKNKYYVDKTILIKEVVEGAKVILMPRPRRFGKTLNLSMLRYFYDNKDDGAKIFQGLEIEKEKRDYGRILREVSYHIYDIQRCKRDQLCRLLYKIDNGDFRYIWKI